MICLTLDLILQMMIYPIVLMLLQAVTHKTVMLVDILHVIHQKEIIHMVTLDAMPLTIFSLINVFAPPLLTHVTLCCNHRNDLDQTAVILQMT